ncbi:hypothetical protein FACS1894176_01720 [Bacteroidia bacterium]|nr:hypothetical protein FACS1894176_01720 [Bacteroidia bacterium]
MVETTSNALEQMQSLNTELTELRRKSDLLKTEIQQKKLEKAEQEKRKQEINDQISTIQDRLKAIEAQTDEEKTLKNSLLDAISGIQTDLVNLAQEIVENSGTPSQVPVENASAMVEEKGFWDKTKDMRNE